MFPTDVDNDFGEFIQSSTLEKIIKKAVPKKSNQSVDVLSMGDMKLLCKSFIDIMKKFSRYVRINLSQSASVCVHKICYFFCKNILKYLVQNLLLR